MTVALEGAAAVAVVVKSSVFTATVTGVLGAFSEFLADRVHGGHEDDEDEEERAVYVLPLSARSAKAVEDDTLLRALRIGAISLVASPIVFSAGMSAALKVPTRTDLMSLLISEAIFVPLAYVAWTTKGGEDCWLYRIAPLGVVVGTWCTFAATYTTSVFIMHHRIAMWPIISSTGDLPPESIFWTVGGLLSGVFVLAMTKGFELGYVGQSKELRDGVRSRSILGYTGGLAMISVGLFRSGESILAYVHLPSAAISWTCMYMLMTYHAQVSAEAMPVPGAPRDPTRSKGDVEKLRDTRLCLLTISGFAGAGFIVLWHFPILCAVSEYIACVTWTGCIGTWAREFDHGMVGAPPGQWGELPGDAGGVGGAFLGRYEAPSHTPRLRHPPSRSPSP
eukprot:Hpha_TRINITY_DN15725_c3_g3::TRINITY_DN15725_c3_g3_i1::g.36891::m.36891